MDDSSTGGGSLPAPGNGAGPAVPDGQTTGRMPSLYLGHGAPPLVDDALWVSQLQAWSAALPRPSAILVVSAHWESAPLTLGATETVPLVHDFWGFPEHYYQVIYPAPGAPDLAAAVEALMPDTEPVVRRRRGLDHGAYVPLTVMYPAADIPVLQISLPTQDPQRLLELGRRLAPLRDQGVLIMGSGFMTHGLPFLNSFRADQQAPEWSREFDAWVAEALARADIDALADFRHRAPALPYAHPTLEHFTPLFVALGTGDLDVPAQTKIDGYWIGLAKRSIEIG